MATEIVSTHRTSEGWIYYVRDDGQVRVYRRPADASYVRVH